MFIWVLSFRWAWPGVCWFCLSFQKNSSGIYWSFLFFYFSFIYFLSDFIIFFLLLTLGFVCSSFSNSFRCYVRLFIWTFSCFSRKACIAMNFPLRTAFAVTHRCCKVVFSLSFCLKVYLISSLISSLTRCLFRSMLFGLHVFFFPPFFFLWLIYSFIPLWSEKMLETISSLLNLLRLVLCPSMWSILENVPCMLEKNVHSVFLFFVFVCLFVFGIYCPVDINYVQLFYCVI